MELSDLGAAAAALPDKPAVIMAESGRTVTYAELDDASNRLAQLLYAHGLRPGDHIAFMLENHPLYLAIAWAAQRSGLYYTPISTRLQRDEVSYILSDCGARVFICSPDLLDSVPAAVGNISLRLLLGAPAPGYLSLEEELAKYPAEPLKEQLEGRDMLYSSGTTGRPKGVKAPMSGSPLGTPDSLYTLVRMLFAGDENSVYLSPAPLYHAAPLRYSMAFLRMGATVVVMDHFDAEGALAAIEEYHVTHSQWVPTMFIRMLRLPAEIRERYDLSGLRYAIHAAAPCPVPVKRQMIEWWGPVLHEYYAGTEGNCFVYCDSPTWLEHPGTVGRTILGTPHVLDEAGEDLPAGREGIVYFDSPADFEYHGDPEKTRQSRDPAGRGWTTLGDIGYVDSDGFVFLTDRRSYMIISGGVNIYPQEAENVLATHPKVHDVAVMGVPDAEMGEAVKAVVQPIDPADAGPDLERELIAYCREQLAHYKCPRSVDFVDGLPRHPTGKLLKRLLRDRYWPA